jgi:alcohol dehydrogenase class IV
MSCDFSITGPDWVISGIGALSQLLEALERLGVTRALLITGRTVATKVNLVAWVEETLGSRHMATFSDCV